MAPAQRLAFVCPRFAEGATVGGAETLLKQLAIRAARAGRQVDFLTTCATNHFTWENELPAGRRRVGDLDVHRFPVDACDVESFLRIQDAFCRGAAVSQADEETWARNSVNSTALCDHLRANRDAYDRVILGPYLFGLTIHAAQILPKKSLLVPCLHDEPFAYLSIMRTLFTAVRGLLFNTEPERRLAQRLFGSALAPGCVVGMGIDPFEAAPEAFARRHKLTAPYVMYSGRREGGKNTPLLCEYVHAFRERTGRDIGLVFTGSGPIEAPGELGPHILDLGFVSEDDKREAMAGASVFIHPSTFESLGIVLLEAFMARTPALVHACGEVLRWQCESARAGFWFRHYPDFEAQLSWMLDHEAQRRSLGEQGRAYVLREYTWERVEQRLFDALDAGPSA